MPPLAASQPTRSGRFLGVNDQLGRNLLKAKCVRLDGLGHVLEVSPRRIRPVAGDVRPEGVLVTQLPQEFDQAEFNLGFVKKASFALLSFFLQRMWAHLTRRSQMSAGVHNGHCHNPPPSHHGT